MSALATAKHLGVRIRAAQRWVKQYEKDLDSIFDNKKQGRKRIINEEHKMTVTKYDGSNPCVVIVDITEHLTNEFKHSNLKFPVAQYMLL